jgi:hypothetical protein
MWTYATTICNLSLNSALGRQNTSVSGYTFASTKQPIGAAYGHRFASDPPAIGHRPLVRTDGKENTVTRCSLSVLTNVTVVWLKPMERRTQCLVVL